MIFRETRPDRPWPQEWLGLSKAFGWDYWDGVDENRNGFVIIRGWGIPFIPHRHGSALSRPAINIVLYEKGRPVFYLLQSGDAHSEDWTENDQGVSFSVPVPGFRSRLKALIQFQAPRIHERQDRSVARESAEPDHLWSPRHAAMLIQGTFELGADFGFEFKGRGYHDRNISRSALEDLSIDRWLWARFPTMDPEGLPLERILYWVLPQKSRSLRGQIASVAWWLTVNSAGKLIQSQNCALTVTEWQTTIYGGLKFPKKIALTEGPRVSEIQLDMILDEGPFYIRWMPVLDRKWVGVGEWVAPDRVLKRWHRWLVSMRIHQLNGPNSFWLPLFSGPRKGRVFRLIQNLWGGGDHG